LLRGANDGGFKCERGTSVPLPDLTAGHCLELTVSGELGTSGTDDPLVGLMAKRKKRLISQSASYKGQNGANHLLVTLNPSKDGGVRFFLGIHSHPEREDKSAGRVLALLRSVGSARPEAIALRAAGTFGYSKDRYRPAITFPDVGGFSFLGPMQPGTPRVELTGLRFRVIDNPIESFVIDVDDEHTIHILPRISLSGHIDEQLPESILSKLLELTNAVIVDTTAGGDLR
jgi:hypothetical protein